MDVLRECLKYFHSIDINFDLYIIADTQKKTVNISDYIKHADESEFFSRTEFAEIASALFYVFGFAKVFYSELDFIKFVLEKQPDKNECYIYNFSRDGISEGKKSLIPSFCDLCNLRYTGSNAFIISLLRNKWYFTQIIANHGVSVPETILCTSETITNAESFMGKVVLIKNVYESASQGLLPDNRILVDHDYMNKTFELMQRMSTKQVLLQQFVDGPECEVLVIQFKNKYYALEPIEIVVEGKDFLDSAASNTYSYKFRRLSDKVDKRTIQKIKEDAIKAATLLQIKDYARFDFRIENTQPYLIDIAGTPYTIRHSSITYLFEEVMQLKYSDIYKVIMACSISNYEMI